MMKQEEQSVPGPSSVPSLMETQHPFDAWILAGGRLFRAHTSVLCAHSPYLRAAVANLGESKLLLPHVPASGFSAVLSFMYTGRLNFSQATVYEVIIIGPINKHAHEQKVFFHRYLLRVIFYKWLG